MVYIEPSFPRGRKAEDHLEQQPKKKSKKNKAEYGASTANDEKQQKPRQRERQQARLAQMEDNKEQIEQSVNASPLTFRTAQEGMLVLGCIYRVNKMELVVSLPGRLFGTVNITAISAAYSERLQGMLQNKEIMDEKSCPSLQELYEPGDLIYVKIKAKQTDLKRFVLTLDPSELHSEFNPQSLVVGLVLCATIQEEEDHGYQMDVGIKNVRAFLPTENIQNNRIDVGANLFCSIVKITHAKGSAVVVLKAFKPGEARKLEIGEVNLDAVVPGCVIPFTISSLLPNGLQGTLFDDTVPAFVNENMLEKPLSKTNNYELFKRLQAKVLYIMPMTKHVFLTLAGFDNNKVSTTEPIAFGTVIEDAKVLNKASSGVWFQIGKKHKALLPSYILKSQFKENYDEQIVMAKYTVGSTHKVRIIRYEVFDRTLIVTDDEKIITSKFYSQNDLKVGDMYECRVTKVLDNKRGYLVSLDNIKGSLSSHNFAPTKPYQVNQTIKLRLIAFETEKQTAQFTNHKEFLKKSASLVTERENLQPGQKALGIVINESEKYFIIVFCNKIKAILFKYIRTVPQDQDKIATLKPGMACVFTVHEVSENGSKISLALPLTDNFKQGNRITTGTITGIFATGADIHLVKENETGVIPPELYSDFPEHNSIFQNVLREKQNLRVVKVKENVYSFRDVEYFRTKSNELKDVRLGQILRAYNEDSMGTIQQTKAHFRLALKDYPQKITFKASDFSSDNKRFTLHESQVVLVKVIRRIQNPKGDYLVVSPKLTDVCSNGVEDPLRYTQAYLINIKELLSRFKAIGKPFAEYSLAQRVTCVVESFIDDSEKMVVKLGNEQSSVKGIATKDPKHEGEYTKGAELDACVVWVDVEKQLVHVCIVKKHLNHITDVSKLTDEDVAGFMNVDEKYKFVTLFSNNYVAVGCLKKTNSPLVILPVKSHYNDFDPIAVEEISEIVILRTYDGVLQGLAEQTYERYKDLRASLKAEKEPTKKNCWLPDDFVEPGEVDSKEEFSGDSGIDKDDVVGTQKDSTVKISDSKKQKATKSKRKNIALPTKGIASAAKALKKKNRKKKSMVKKLKQRDPFVISQLDGTDDVLMGMFNRKDNKKYFLSKRPTAKNSISNQQSGSIKHEKQNKMNQIVKQSVDSEVKKPDKKEVKDGPTTKTGKIQKPKKETLPGAESFWKTQHKQKRKYESESSSDDDQIEMPVKKRLNAKERFEKLKQEESRIRKIEEELADASVDPHTPDQFDRLVLAQPNSSLVWIRYMVFHMESAEIDKARAVARRAIKAINFREEGERLNVWLALLNLELRYETVETFKEVLVEAIQYNDPFKVYSKVVDILVDCGKHSEVSEIIDILQKKFRKESEMWFLVATCYYKMGERVKVKPLLAKALKALENKEHIPLIVKFAFLHNRNENQDEAHILFEHLLTSYPKRTDLWSQYVDMLVKDGLVDVARQTLDRAINQRLPLRNMKTLYTKYVNFEEKHGTREAVRRIKQMAADYVKQQLAANGISGDKAE
ncbi:protein RRP5 homolog [Uranotaenia lowii]|uniref:protein RRP5 homolog n=1 Tax=Uranotaenia lowii TaxID=190385 RepID=UPI002478A8D4|nr:protein RRP5 homolog [Uranotaenia lowii]